MNVTEACYNPLAERSDLDRLITFSVNDDRLLALSEGYLAIRGTLDFKNMPTVKISNFGFLTLFEEAELLINDRPLETVRYLGLTVTYSSCFRLSNSTSRLMEYWGTRDVRKHTTTNPAIHTTAVNGVAEFQVLLPLKLLFPALYKNIACFSCKKLELILRRSANDKNFMHEISGIKQRYATITKIHLAVPAYTIPGISRPKFSITWDTFHCKRLPLSTDSEQRIDLGVLAAAQKPKYLFLTFLDGLDNSAKIFYEAASINFENIGLFCNDKIIGSVPEADLKNNALLAMTTYLRNVEYYRAINGVGPTEQVDTVLNPAYYRDKAIFIFNLLESQIEKVGILNLQLYIKTEASIPQTMRLFGFFVFEAEFRMD